MNKVEKKKAAKEWENILVNHPTFARLFLAQQVILMEASWLGFRVVERRMCELLNAQLPVLFADYWESHCNQFVVSPLPGIWGCLQDNRNNPTVCFSLPHEDEWFDDPFAKGKTIPPKPPVPPLKRQK